MLQKTKIIHIVRDMIPGGAEHVVMNYVKNYNRDKFTVSVCVLHRLSQKQREEIENEDIKLHWIQKRRGLDFSAIRKITKILKDEKIDLIHLHNFSASLYGTLSCLMARKRRIFRTEHNIFVCNTNVAWKLRAYCGYILGCFHKRIIAVSDRVRLSHEQKDIFCRRKYTTVYNGIDPSRFNIRINKKKYLAEFGLSEDSVVVGNIASLTVQKAHETLFGAGKIVLDNNPEVIFLIVGDGPRKQELNTVVDGMGLRHRIIFTGIRNDVPALLQFMDIFAISSDWEGLPMTILEAMASGTPVVATDVGGNAEAIIDGETGYIVPRGNSEELARCLNILINRADKRVAMGRKGKERVLTTFRAEIMTRETERLYDAG